MTFFFDSAPVQFSDLHLHRSPITGEVVFDLSAFGRILTHNGLPASNLIHMTEREVSEVLLAWALAHKATHGSLDVTEHCALQALLADRREDRGILFPFHAQLLPVEARKGLFGAWRQTLSDDLCAWRGKMASASRESAKAPGAFGPWGVLAFRMFGAKPRKTDPRPRRTYIPMPEPSAQRRFLY